MGVIERGLDSLGLLSDSVRESLNRRLRELGGLALILFAVALALALATWSVQDPSLSHATNKPMRNMLGGPGAVVSDLLMQLFGIAAIAFILPIAVWGWRLITHRALSREALRLMFWVIGLMLAAACASSLPRGTGWPLPAGLGGVTGDALIRLPTWLAGGSLGFWTRFVLATVSGAGMLTCFAVAAGYGLKAKPKVKKAAPVADEIVESDDEQERAWISLGWLAHGFLSLKARISRLLAGQAPLRTAPLHDSVPASSRVEPRFEGATLATLAPQLDAETSDDEDEDEEEVEVAPPVPRKPKAAPRTSRKWRLSVAAARTARHAEGDRARHVQPGGAADQLDRARRRAGRISACAARSSMRGPARW